ncbi:hypothetical protein Tco_0772955 [Tanacetum coccineum]|uniref:Uncharacterized protein n=1 Tax=Tanacetum coccineum TaxID=301880 RepID=A0ABQ4ZJC9_9ASTR
MEGAVLNAVDTPIRNTAGNPTTQMNFASTNYPTKEELRGKGIESPSKLLSPKYLSQSSLAEQNRNPSSLKRVHFVHSIIILSKEDEAKEEGSVKSIVTENKDHEMTVESEEAFMEETNEEIEEEKAHLLEDKQIPSVGLFDDVSFLLLFRGIGCLWRNTRDLGHFGEEYGQDTALDQIPLNVASCDGVSVWFITNSQKILHLEVSSRENAFPTKAHLAPKQPIQVNKITSSCEVCSGPYDTQYCMENPVEAFVEYASLVIDEGEVCLFHMNQRPKGFNEAPNAWKESQTFWKPYGLNEFHVHQLPYKRRASRQWNQKPIKVTLLKYLSQSSLAFQNRNPPSPKRVHFVNSIIILNKEDEAKEEGSVKSSVTENKDHEMTVESEEEFEEETDEETEEE